MDKLELAAKLDGMDYDRFSITEMSTISAHGLVVVYGASDDLMEFDGAICDELGAFEGGTAYINAAGLFDVESQYPCCQEYDECKFIKAERDKCRTIRAVWCGRGNAFPWTYETEIPHEKFSLFNNGEPYCQGIVFSIRDLALDAPQSASKVEQYEDFDNAPEETAP